MAKKEIEVIEYSDLKAISNLIFGTLLTVRSLRHKYTAEVFSIESPILSELDELLTESNTKLDKYLEVEE